MMKRRELVLVIPYLAIAGITGTTGLAHAEDFGRGEDLYNQQCQSCHEDLMHERNRRLKSIDALRKRIEDWASHTGNSWTREDIDDVLYYLNKSFYHFDQKPL